jgi:two-component system response regulator GlrR
LFYRIQVVPLNVPPLRERRDDVPLLAQHFLERSAKRVNKNLRGITPEAMQKLVRYHWPGNVRELENTLEKAAVMAMNDMITPDLLPTINVAATIEGQLKPLTEAKEAFEKEYLEELLQVSGGNISRAAQYAGRYRADFYKLLRKYGLHPGDKKAEQEEKEDQQKSGV